jgi:sugar phosphate permease
MADVDALPPRKESTHHDELVEAVRIGSLKNVKEQQIPWIEYFEEQDQAWREATEKKLLRKIDFMLIPMLSLIYLLNFLDRSNLAQARLGGLEDDLKMKGTDFNLATSIFFVGYLLMQLPSNLLITRVRPSLYLGSVVTLWGVVSTCNSAVHSFGGLLAVRICLGLAEAPFFPGLVINSWTAAHC